MKHSCLKNLGLKTKNDGTIPLSNNAPPKSYLSSYSPVDNSMLGEVSLTTIDDYKQVVSKLIGASTRWKNVPAPKRGELVRQFSLLLREKKEDLGRLVSLEMGKSLREGMGEVQEMIDICEFALGLSRQLYGKTIASERPDHHMIERWHPLGIVGIITAFNFPVAVWSWNAMIALVCGNVCIWKPSEKTPLCAIACQHLLQSVLNNNNINYPVSAVITGNADAGKWLAKDKYIDLVSATGSVPMGRSVASTVGHRLGKYLLELSGNNAMIVAPSADLELALSAALFGAIGTAGQRCTSTRRLIIHSSIFDAFTTKLVNAYNQIKIGNPFNDDNHMGPLIDQEAVETYIRTLDIIEKQGGQFLLKGGILSLDNLENGNFVRPSIARVSPDTAIAKEETFGPILYVMEYEKLEEAIVYQNNVSQGLSSSILTTDVRESEIFTSVNGSDCGIANVNVGTSGAEIGGAFGGEKDTGGGRESGSDSWKAYMRRQTITINYGQDIPLAQGIKFEF